MVLFKGMVVIISSSKLVDTDGGGQLQSGTGQRRLAAFIHSLVLKDKCLERVIGTSPLDSKD